MKTLARQLLPVFISLLCFTSLSAGQPGTPFSVDSAAAYLRVISVDIGARPMGSPNERRVAEFAIRKFKEFGCADAYLMPIRDYPGFMGAAATNTQSGVAVGILRGTSSRIIVLGAHMDSSDPDVPGANDDGSGCAVVVELARVLSQRKNESTIVFALFGGEEAGLQGSKYFVEHFADIDRVALMLQSDMANGSPILYPTLDFPGGSSPEWLVRASYEEIDKLGHAGLHFPTDFFTFMGAMPGGGVGSDHEPFLAKGIPAIDFTSDALDPIHTPQDNFENFKPEGLKRSGDLLYSLVERFDAGVPEQKTGNYFLYEVATFPVFIPIWLLWVISAISLLVGIAVLVAVRRRRQPEEGSARPKVPALKMFLLLLIIQTCVWLSENVVALIKGVRYPWMTDINGYYVLGFFAACIGIWIALQLSRRLRLRHDSYSYFLRAFIMLVLFTGLGAILSAKLALYPATALLLISLAMYVRHPILKLLFWLLSPQFMFRLFFTVVFDFIARALHMQPEITPVITTVLTFVYIVFFSVWSLPFLLGFAAIYFDSKVDLIWLRKIRRAPVGIAVIVLFALTVWVLSSRETYSKEWKPSVWVEQDYNADSTTGKLTVRSPEYLDGIRLHFGASDTVLRGMTTSVEFANALPALAEPWISVDRKITSVRNDTTLSVEVMLKLGMKHRPYKLKVGYSIPRGKLTDATSPFAIGTTDRTVSAQWSAFPDTSLAVPFSFSIPIADTLSLKEQIEAVFVEEAQPIAVETRISSPIVRRTRIVREEVVPFR